MPKELAGQRMLVIGASSGIGAAVVRLAAGGGAMVAASARRADKLEGVVAGLPQAIVLPADVRDAVSIRSAVDGAVAAFGGLDAVIFATAVSPLVPMADATLADWRDVLDTNVVGCALVAAAVAPHLVASNGRLVVLSSKAVRQPFADLGLYSTSKVALDGLIRCLPIEFPGLHVTRVMVGNTHSTAFADAWDPVLLDASMHKWIAQGVLGSGKTMHPDEVAEAILTVLTSPTYIEDLAVLEHPAPVVRPHEGAE